MRLRTKGVAAVAVWTLVAWGPLGASAQPREDTGIITAHARERQGLTARVPRTFLGSVTWRY